MGTHSSCIRETQRLNAREKIYYFHVLAHSDVKKTTTEISSGTQKPRKHWWLKSLNLHEVAHHQVSSFPEYIKQDKSNLVFNAAENSFDSSS